MIFGSLPLCFSTHTPRKWERRICSFWGLILLFGVGQQAVYAQSNRGGKAERLLGMYVFVGERLTADSAKKLPAGFMPFLKFCGYNTLEFCDYSFEYPESERTSYLEAFRTRIKDVHRQGLKVFVILATNMSREWSNLSAEPGGDELTKIMFNADAHPDEFKLRLTDVRQSITKGFSEADGFEVFAGDWGGCMGEGCGYKQYLSFARAYAQILRDLGLRSQLTLNTWELPIGEPRLIPSSTFWDAETELSEKVIDSDISFATAVTLPGHNPYRGLTRTMYTQANQAVPEWPDPAAINKIHARGDLAYLCPILLWTMIGAVDYLAKGAFRSSLFEGTGQSVPGAGDRWSIRQRVQPFLSDGEYFRLRPA